MSTAVRNGTGIAAVVADDRRERDLVDVVDLAGRERDAGIDDLVAGREDRHARLREHLHRRQAKRGERARAAGVEQRAGAKDRLAAADVGALAADVLAAAARTRRRGRLAELRFGSVSSTITTASAPCRKRSARGDLDAFAGADRACRDLPGERLPDAGGASPADSRDAPAVSAARTA